jgi:voltage-gated potassium channel
MRLPIIVSAVLPLIVVPEAGDRIGIVVGVVTWLVFLVDYVVHARHLDRYGRTRLGRFDLFVVVATAPWFLLPGAHAGGFVAALRRQVEVLTERLTGAPPGPAPADPAPGEDAPG